MRSHPPSALRVTAAVAALWLSACGGGGGDPGAPATSAPTPVTAAFNMVSAAIQATVAPSLVWTQSYPTPQVWHSIASNASGDVIVAGEAPTGLVHVSADGGATWTSGNSTPGVWISSAISSAGDRIVAVQYQGGMFTSTDHGVTWNRVTSSPLVNQSGGVLFEAVTMSQDGQRIAAVVQNGPILLSHDAGATWTTGTLPDQPQARWWRWIDGSPDGSVLVAVSHNGEVYRSTDAGTTWTALTVAIGSPLAAVSEHWYRVKVSADGSTIALAANTFGGGPGSGIFVSHDGGRTWTRGFTLVADYTGIAMSSDGQTIAATLSNTNGTPGRVLLSTDGGATFVALAMPGSDTDWRSITMSANAARMAVVAGAFDTNRTGLLYTSRASSTPSPSPAPTPAPSPSPSPAPTPAPAPAPTPAPAPAPTPAPTPAPAPTCSAPAWNTTTRYLPGMVVTRNGIMYVATALSASVWNVNSPPEWTPTYWSVTTCSAPAPAPSPAPSPAPTPAPTPAPAPAPTPAPSPAPTPAPSPAPSCSAPAWNGTTRYLPGNTVTRNGTLYVATALSASVWNVNSPPEWTPTYWTVTTCK